MRIPIPGWTTAANGYGASWTRQAANVTKALLLWNGGGNPDYPAEVLARMSKYQ